VIRRSFFTAILIALVWATAPPAPASGQDEVASYISVEPATGRAVVELGRLLDDRSLADAIHQGLPLRINVDAELWRDRLFDSEDSRAQWKASVVYDPVTLLYDVEVLGQEPLSFPALAEVRAHLQESFALDLRPRQPGRYYYLAIVEMETLSLSDLEELRRWLRGDLAGATEGEGQTDGAVGRGVRRLFVRALGLPTRRVRLRTPAFTFQGNDPT
jgi:hypothetical protein